MKKKPDRLLVIPRKDHDPTRFAKTRRAMIGGTDLAPILGISEKRTRFAVWASKVGDISTDDGTLQEESEAGTFLEPLILQRFANRLGVVVDSRLLTYLLRDEPFLGANPDGLVFRVHAEPIGGVDAKSRSPYVRARWGDAGSSDIPPDELAQAQWYMEIMDLPVWYLAVFFDRILTTFVVHRDRELGALMVQEARAFWTDYIIPRREPPFEGPAAATYIKRKFPKALEPIREATWEEANLITLRVTAKQQADAWKTKLDDIDTQLKARIGEALGVKGQGFKVTWSDRAATSRTDWDAVMTELRSFPLAADPEIAKKIRDTIDQTIARHTKAGEPSRTFRATFSGPRVLSPATIEKVPPPQLTEGDPHGE